METIASTHPISISVSFSYESTKKVESERSNSPINCSGYEISTPLHTRSALESPQRQDPLNSRTMTSKKAIQLFKETIGCEDEKHSKLARLLNYDSRALHLVAHYLKKNQETTSIDDYLEKYRAQLISLSLTNKYLERYRGFLTSLTLEEMEVSSQAIRIPAILKLSLKALQEEQPQAVDLLHFCAYLAPENISYEVIEAWAQKRGIPTRECLALLKEYSLLIDNPEDPETKEATFSIDPQLQCFIQKEIDSDKGDGATIESPWISLPPENLTRDKESNE